MKFLANPKTGLYQAIFVLLNRPHSIILIPILLAYQNLFYQWLKEHHPLSAQCVINDNYSLSVWEKLLENQQGAKTMTTLDSDHLTVNNR